MSSIFRQQFRVRRKRRRFSTVCTLAFSLWLVLVPIAYAWEEYRVRPGDSLSEIVWSRIRHSSARRLYGAEGMIAQALKMNPGIAHPDHLKLGQKILVPDFPALRTPASVSAESMTASRAEVEPPVVESRPSQPLSIPPYEFGKNFQLFLGLGGALANNAFQLDSSVYSARVTHSGVFAFPSGVFGFRARINDRLFVRGNFDGFCAEYPQGNDQVLNAIQARLGLGFDYAWKTHWSLGFGYDYQILRYLVPDPDAAGAFLAKGASAQEAMFALRYRVYPIKRVELEMSALMRVSMGVSGSGEDSFSASAFQFSGYGVRTEARYLLTPSLFAGAQVYWDRAQFQWTQTNSFAGQQRFENTDISMGIHLGFGF